MNKSLRDANSWALSGCFIAPNTYLRCPNCFDRASATLNITEKKGKPGALPQIPWPLNPQLSSPRSGVAGKPEINAWEVENLISTRHKRGYMLNCAKENVLILTKDLLLIVLSFFLDVDQFWPDFLTDVPDLFFLC